MDYTKRMDALRSQIDRDLQTLCRDKEPSSLYEPMQYLFDSGGKRIRPLLLILSCEAVGGAVRDCLDAALAVELLHTFTLVHDDMMDHDDLRRGHETVHRKWDEATAILTGDGLVTLAYQTLLKTTHLQIQEILKSFTDGLLVLCEGQAMDKEFEDRSGISLDDYNRMIYQKTGKLIEVSCEIGAILGDASAKEKTALKEFGKNLGLAFQIQDDMLDILSHESVLGKPIGSDLVENKKTYLTVHFYTNGSASQIDRFNACIHKKVLEPEDIQVIRDIYEETGTLESSRQCIQNLISEALRHLEGIKPNESGEHLKQFSLQLRDRVS
jgi:geranylgeranyl diphosphate synthase type II